MPSGVGVGDCVKIGMIIVGKGVGVDRGVALGGGVWVAVGELAVALGMTTVDVMVGVCVTAQPANSMSHDSHSQR